MDHKEALVELEQRFAEIKDLQAGISILGWDQEVMMPPGGADARANTMATLTTVVHERTTARPLARLVERLHDEREALKPRQRRTVELARRMVKKATAIPSSLAAEIARTESRGLEAWKAARATSDFARFAPLLEHMVDLKREVAKLNHKKRKGSVYDALLDDYEPGATVESIDPVLAELSEMTTALVKHIASSTVVVDTTPLTGDYHAQGQREFAKDVVLAMGVDLARGRLDLSTHPFCGGVGPGDVRMTGRYDPRDLRPGLFGAVHEAGHGLYEQGLDPKRARSPLGGAVSMAVHESQSRLWENQVARSRPFWQHWLPRLAEMFPHLRNVSLDAFWRAVNGMRPSLIRVEADELTYNLHIVLRYEIERDLFEGRLRVRDLPERWNAGMQAKLGIVPENDAVGVLQDIHWAMGAFGYFPTYSLGNLYAAQIMEAARVAMPELDTHIAAGNLRPLVDWLHENVHRHDQVYAAPTLLKKISGKSLSVEPFRRYITHKVEAVFGPMPS